MDSWVTVDNELRRGGEFPFQYTARIMERNITWDFFCQRNVYFIIFLRLDVGCICHNWFVLSDTGMCYPGLALDTKWYLCVNNMPTNVIISFRTFSSR